MAGHPAELHRMAYVIKSRRQLFIYDAQPACGEGLQEGATTLRLDKTTVWSLM